MNVKIKLVTEDIIKATSGILINGDMGIPFRGISTDTRILKPGYLFWALKGKNFDGHDFWKEAIEKGAKGIIFSRFPKGFRIEQIPKTISVILVKDTLKALGDLAHFWRKRLKCHLVAITGSCGKTTTKEITYEIISKFLKCAKNYANYNNLIGVPLSLLAIPEDTEVAVLELGTNQKGEIEKLSQIVEPYISVITSIYPSHLEGLDSIEGVLEEKISLFKNTKPDGVLIYNFDQEILREKVKHFPQKKISFGFNEKADLFIKDLQICNAKVKGKIGFNKNFYPFELENIGKHNLLNLLSALSVAVALNIDLNQVIPKLGKEISLYRRENLIKKDRVLIIDDTYNANPGSMKMALGFLNEISKDYEKKIVILGDMKELGKEAEKFHREIGEIAGKIVDLAIFIGEMNNVYREGFIKVAREKPVKTFKTVEEFLAIPLNEILEINKEKIAILVKASQALRLERVVEKLVKEI